MFKIDLKAGKVTVVSAAPHPNDAEAFTYYIDAKSDVKDIPTSGLVEIYNTIAKSDPELQLREVNRFSTRENAENRVWGLFVGLKANVGTEEEAAPKKVKKVKAAKVAKPKKEVKPKKERSLSKERTIKDKALKRGAKVYPLREGSLQEKAFKLLATEEGMDVNRFIAEMNKGPGKPKWTRGNAWSSLSYILHNQHGYGVRCKDGRFYAN